MKNRASFFAFLLLLIVSAGPSCKKENLGDCFKRTGKVMTEARDLPAFDKIYARDNVDVILTEDTGQEVLVEAGKNLLGLIRTEVREGTLYIRNDNRCNFTRRYDSPIRVLLRVPRTFASIITEGCGQISNTNTFTGDTIHLEVRGGSADIDFTVSSQKVVTAQHGAGDITVRGTADHLYAYNIGTGYTLAEDLSAGYCYAFLKTVGITRLNVRDLLQITVTSRGNVYYRGNPEIESHIEGTGQLLPMQ